ncbi:MAG: hypothetical protein FVQ80_11465 [Planctomycetes bacterium]|nr:hypothetical protein [Planctomycetota bacterium]
MKTLYKYNTQDVTFTLESNFDLGDWMEAWEDNRLVKNILNRSHRVIMSTIRNRFTGGYGPNRVRWQALSPLTVARKGHRKPLLFTGKLQRKIRATFYGSELVITAGVPYARLQQMGGSYTPGPRQQLWLWINLMNKQGRPYGIGRITIPARPFFGFDTELRLKIKKIIASEVKKTENMGT